VNGATDGTEVNLVYDATFARLNARERFTFSVRKGKAELVGYRLD
jgi:hypothetical protein